MSKYSNYSIVEFSLLVKRYIRFIGLGTFSVKNNKVYVDAFDLFCLFSNLAFGCFVFYLSLNYGLYRLTNFSILLSLGVFITMMFGSVVSIVAMISIFFNRYRIWEVISILETVILKFRDIGVPPNFKRYVIIFSIFGSVSLLLVILGLIIMAVFFGYSEKPEVLIVFGYLSASFSAMLGWSSMFHLAIYLRLNLINETIRYLNYLIIMSMIFMYHRVVDKNF